VQHTGINKCDLSWDPVIKNYNCRYLQFHLQISSNKTEFIFYFNDIGIYNQIVNIYNLICRVLQKTIDLSISNYGNVSKYLWSPWAKVRIAHLGDPKFARAHTYKCKSYRLPATGAPHIIFGDCGCFFMRIPLDAGEFRYNFFDEQLCQLYSSPTSRELPLTRTSGSRSSGSKYYNNVNLGSKQVSNK
jgi:hypothetical protein